MSQRKVVTNVIGLAGCAGVAWGMYGLMLTGSCGGQGAPPCPPESVPYFVALGVGMLVAIISAVAGGRLAFIGLFLAVAGGSLWAGFELLPSGGGTVPLIIGGVFGAVTLLPIAFLPAVAARRRKAQRLIDEGATAIGTVTDVRDTGVTVNMNPRVALTLRIEPQDGSSVFDGTKTITASRLELPYPGQRFPIWYDRADRTNFMLGTKVQPDAPPEIRRLFALAESGNPARPGTGVAASADPLDRLAKLNELRLSGALSETEFEIQKARILDAT